VDAMFGDHAPTAAQVGPRPRITRDGPLVSNGWPSVSRAGSRVRRTPRARDSRLAVADWWQPLPPDLCWNLRVAPPPDAPGKLPAAGKSRFGRRPVSQGGPWRGNGPATARECRASRSGKSPRDHGSEDPLPEAGTNSPPARTTPAVRPASGRLSSSGSVTGAGCRPSELPRKARPATALACLVSQQHHHRASNSLTARCASSAAWRCSSRSTLRTLARPITAVTSWSERPWLRNQYSQAARSCCERSRYHSATNPSFSVSAGSSQRQPPSGTPPRTGRRRRRCRS
jgi:hypothetical protein